MSRATPGEQRILLVDDDPDTRTICRTLLEHAGYRVWTAADGAEGHRVAQEVRPELIVCEGGSCLADGVPLPRALRGEPWGAEVRVLVLTTRALAEELDEMRGWGADRVLVKPVAPSRLLTEVEGLLGAGR